MNRGRRGAVCLLLLLSTGCGFHLRGTFAVPAWLHDVEIRQAAPEDTLARELRQMLQANGVSLRGAGTQSGAVIQLGAVSLNRRLLAAGSGNRTKDYEYLFEVPVTVIDPEGKERLKAEKITVRREMDYDETQVLAKAAELDVMKQQMTKDAVSQIMRRLQARRLQ